MWVRTCQECGAKQEAKKPDPEKELADSYRNAKCRSCKSESLDYGSSKWTYAFSNKGKKLVPLDDPLDDTM